MRIRLSDPDGGAPALGEYLGTSAHLTGFHVGSGAAVHMHPLGAPSTTDDAVELTPGAQAWRAAERHGGRSPPHRDVRREVRLTSHR